MVAVLKYLLEKHAEKHLLQAGSTVLGGAGTCCDKCHACVVLVVFVQPLKISTDSLTFGTSYDLIVSI